MEIKYRDYTKLNSLYEVYNCLYQRVKKLSYILSYIKQDIYTFLFYFLRVSCSHSSHSLHHPSLGPSISSLTLRQRAQPFLSGRRLFLRVLHLGILISLYPASSLFGLSTSSLILRQRAQIILSRKCPFFRALHFDMLISHILRHHFFGLNTSSVTLW